MLCVVKCIIQVSLLYLLFIPNVAYSDFALNIDHASS